MVTLNLTDKEAQVLVRALVGAIEVLDFQRDWRVVVKELGLSVEEEIAFKQKFQDKAVETSKSPEHLEDRMRWPPSGKCLLEYLAEELRA